MKIFISPHDDDHALFGAFTCLREKPQVVVVLDSYIQPLRGEEGCSAEERAKETAESCEILGVTVKRLGLHDNVATFDDILDALAALNTEDVETVYVPMYQMGNPHHDIICHAAGIAFPGKVTYYSTYTPTQLYTTAEKEIIPTPDEQELKMKSLYCYKSQIRINYVHFQAVFNKSEWTSRNP